MKSSAPPSGGILAGRGPIGGRADTARLGVRSAGALRPLIELKSRSVLLPS